LYVFAKNKIADQIQESSIKKQLLRRGYKYGIGYAGSKGAVYISFEYEAKKYTFVNCHLASSTYKRRKKDFKAIHKKISNKILGGSDYVFWGGDFNFRKPSEAPRFKDGKQSPDKDEFRDVVGTIVTCDDSTESCTALTENTEADPKQQPERTSSSRNMVMIGFKEIKVPLVSKSWPSTFRHPTATTRRMMNPLPVRMVLHPTSKVLNGNEPTVIMIEMDTTMVKPECPGGPTAFSVRLHQI